MSTCEAASTRRRRCLHPAAYTVELEGAPRRICGHHVLQARRGTVRIWKERPPAGPSPGDHGHPWTEAEDALLADPDLPGKEVAARTGRTVAAVLVRRSLKRRGLR